MHAHKSNSRKRKSYASMDVEKKSALLHSRRIKYRERVANRTDPGASTSTQPTRSQQKYMRRSSVIQPDLLSKIEDIPLRAWSLPFSSPCPLCGVVLYLREPKGFCCLHGQISLALPTMPQELWNLYTSLDSADAVHFRKRCRTYNNTTAFSSLGITYDESLAKSNKGIYSLRIQGAVYHFIRDLVPVEGPGRHLQLYFYEPENEIQNRLSQSGDLQLHILQHIVELMKRNPYALFFRGLQELPNLHEYNIVLRADPSLDMRVYNLPTVNQVAAIWNEMSGVPAAQPHDIRVYTSSVQTHCVHYYYGCYDPLQYPLLFPFGESGWHTGISHISLAAATAHSRRHKQCSGQIAVYPHGHQSAESILDAELENLNANKWHHNNVSAREFYCYLFQVRPADVTNILRAGRLAQQYQIDCYVKIETQRLDYLRSEQRRENLHTESYEGIIDSMMCQGKLRGSDIGQRFVLPASYVGSPRDMRRRYLNALALVSEYGKPYFFITMTCNPNWPEIRAGLLPGEEAQNRSDLVARAFRGRREEFKNDILREKVFGDVAAYLYVIEFQKIGLPHAHWIIILQPRYKITSLDVYDHYVSAELPGAHLQEHLHACVVRHMMHGPCGLLNPSNMCMRENKCKNRYPKDYAEITSQHEDSYPLYRRRNDQQTVHVRGQKLDNRWVVPYNAYLLAKFDCHINVEICVGLRLIKYLYKYVCKGTNKIAFNVVEQPSLSNADEITDFQSARWLCAPEAMWRIYAFILSEIHPAVLQLHVHLPNHHHVSFPSSRSLSDVLANPNTSKTQLTEFFSLNANSPIIAAMGLLYKDFPRFFV